MRTVPEDSGFTGLLWPGCDDFEGTGRLSDTLLGVITPVVDLEGENGDVGHIYGKSSGMVPDLDVFETPWIEDATMEWRIHAIVLRTTLPLDNCEGGKDDSAAEMDESCDVGVIGVTKDLEGPEMVSAVCEEYPSVHRFEGEEDDQCRCETTDLPVAKCLPSQIEFPIFDRAPKPMFVGVTEVSPGFLNRLECSAKFLEGLETRYDASTTHISRFEPFSGVGTYEEGQGGAEDVNRVGELTLVDTVHLERPPGKFLMSVKFPTVGILDPGDFAPKMTHEKVEALLPFVTNVPVDCVKFVEGAETCDDEWAVSIAVVRCLVPSLAIGTYGKGQVDVESSYGVFGITLDDIAHLVRPPGCIFERCWLEDKALSLLIAVVDACHMVLMRQLILPFLEWRSCVGLRGSVGISDSAGQTRHKAPVFCRAGVRVKIHGFELSGLPFVL
jgi:hypothetical protein